MDTSDIVLLVLGVVLGFIFGMIGNTIVVYCQFKGSIAGRRLEWVKAATEAFLTKPDRQSEHRDKYRYSLGVIIDDLARTGADGKKDNGRWPLLAEEKDRWDRFNRFVRPVVDDINSYSFLGGFRKLPGQRRLRQLHQLAELCFQIENVVMQIDAASESPSVVDITKEGICPKSGADKEDDRLKSLGDEYIRLVETWEHWKDTL